jgi:hypothetical protein
MIKVCGDDRRSFYDRVFWSKIFQNFRQKQIDTITGKTNFLLLRNVTIVSLTANLPGPVF